MSFSDFGRTAMAALSPTANVQVPSRNVRRSSDPMPPRMSEDGRRRRSSSREMGVSKPSKVGSQSSLRRRSDGGAIANRRSNSTNSLEIQRGVRPKLNHIQCPVTSKKIMDDVLTVQDEESHLDASQASTSYSSSEATSHDTSYDNDSADDYSESDIGLNHTDNNREEIRRRRERNNRNRRSSYIDGRKGVRPEKERGSQIPNSPSQRQRRLPKHYNNVRDTLGDEQPSSKHNERIRDSKTKVPDKKQSKTSSARQNQASGASKLSTEIALFQKMVADLAAVSGRSSSSPEAMWKSRILLRSAADAERDLKVSLESEHIDIAAGKSVKAAALAASRKKMLRDFHRASEQLRVIKEETDRRQKAEISTLTAKEAAEEGADPTTSQKRALMGAAEAEEDFFERAMRERQAEVQKISDGMKKVQDIYADLAGLVDGQQEQIDKLEELNEEVKADTRAGLEEIQHGIWKLCAAEQYQNDGIGVNDTSGGTANRSRKKKVLDASDIFHCMMACQGNSVSEGNGRGVLSLDEDLYNEEKPTSATVQRQSKDYNANYYRDDVKAEVSEWNLPNLDDVQESAFDALQKGHAMVEDFVGHVQEVVGASEFRDVEKRISCTAQQEDVSEISLGDGENSGVFDGVGDEGEENVEQNHSRQDASRRHRSEEEHCRSRSRRSSRSHSKQKQKQKHENLRYQHELDQWGDDNDRKYDEKRIKKDRHRRKRRHNPSVLNFNGIQ